MESFLHQLGVAEDGGQRCPELVAHVGDELRLVLTGDLEFAAFLRDLVEQPRVLDGDDSLVREGPVTRPVVTTAAGAMSKLETGLQLPRCRTGLVISVNDVASQKQVDQRQGDCVRRITL